jgi:DNA-directed RNA polymerase subunit RPC12/RpoP
MTTDNPAPNPHTISDELAQAFLRDREIDCPRCGYSLRDSTSHICPECGGAFTLIARDPDCPDPFQKLIRFALLIMMLLALLEVTTRGLSLYQLLFVAGMSPTALGPYGWILITTVTLWPIVFLVVMSLWLKSRRNHSMTQKSIVVPAIIMLALYTIPALIDIVWFLLL